jgi:uncharacterized membrane protein YidH (DUF202 family)
MGARGRGGGEGVRTRDHLANVRTTLTWVRLGIVAMALGYALDRLAAISSLRGVSGGSLEQFGRPYGMLAVLGGVGVCCVGFVRFLRARARIESAGFEPKVGIDLTLIVIVTVGGLVLTLLLWTAR